MKTALHIAVEFNEFRLIALLCSSGADTTYQHNGKTPLIKAIDYDAFTDQIPVLEMLATPDALLICGPKEDTALHRAALNGNLIFVKALISFGANPNSVNSVGKTAMQYAAAFGGRERPAVIQYLHPLSCKAVLRDVSELVSGNVE